MCAKEKMMHIKVQKLYGFQTDVAVPEDMKAGRLLESLAEAGFLESDTGVKNAKRKIEYILLYPPAGELDKDKTLAENGVAEGDIITVAWREKAACPAVKILIKAMNDEKLILETEVSGTQYMGELVDGLVSQGLIEERTASYEVVLRTGGDIVVKQRIKPGDALEDALASFPKRMELLLIPKRTVTVVCGGKREIVDIPEDMTLQAVADELKKYEIILDCVEKCNVAYEPGVRKLDLNKSLVENEISDYAEIGFGPWENRGYELMKEIDFNLAHAYDDPERRITAHRYAEKNIPDEKLSIRIQVMSPVNEGSVEVEVPCDLTVQDIIDDLTEAGFVQESQWGYVMTGTEKNIVLDNARTLEENGVREFETVRLHLCSVR